MGNHTVYEKYKFLDYNSIPESQMLRIIDELFEIEKKYFDEDKHMMAISKITITSLKLNYKKVKDELRKIYPLSFPEIEKNSSLLTSHDLLDLQNEISNIDEIESIHPCQVTTKSEKKQLSKINNLVQSFKT